MALGVGLVYDERMCAHQDDEYMQSEQPARITSIYDRLKSAGIVERCCHKSPHVYMYLFHIFGSPCYFSAIGGLITFSSFYDIACLHLSIFLCIGSLI
jgi:hypothetical protein